MLILDNPLLMREVRRRMRGRMFSWSLIIYLVALGLVSILIMVGMWPDENRPHMEIIKRTGEIVIALFIAPMLTAGLATAEKERNTFEFLKVTTLHASTFVSDACRRHQASCCWPLHARCRSLDWPSFSAGSRCRKSSPRTCGLSASP